MVKRRIHYSNIAISVIEYWCHRVSIFRHGSRFRRNFIKVASANALSQALPIFVAPILTRLYLPDDFGAVALFIALLSIVSAIATMRIDWLVSTVNSDNKAANVFTIGLINVTIVSVIIFIIKYLGWHESLHMVRWKLINKYLWLLPVALMGSGIQLMMAGWFVRVADLAPIASTKVRQSVGLTIFNVLGGVFSFGAGGLIVSATTSFWLGASILARQAWKTLGAYLQKINPQTLCASFKDIWRKYAVFGSTGIVNNCGLFLPTLLISAYFTPVELGWYALMQRMATAPLVIFTGALGQSFWAEARQLIKQNPVALKILYLKTTKRLMLISLPVAIVCLSGPLYIGPIFGLKKWAGAGSVLAALTPFILSQFIISTLSPLIIICEKENWLLVWDTIRTTMIICLFICAHLLSIQFIPTISMFSILMAIMYILLFVKNLRSLDAVILTLG